MRRAFSGLVGCFLLTLTMIPERGAPGAQGLPNVQSLPPSRSGRELLGKPFALEGLHWVNPPARTQPEKPEGLELEGPEFEGKVTLIRWFTDRCPYCARSIPAIMRLQEEFGERGFQTVAVYHPKPPGSLRDRDPVKAAAYLGYRGPLAVDADWSVLKRVYLAKHPEGATSASFLLDRSGNVRYVHPGPEFGPTDDPHLKQVNQDYQDIKAAIETLLAESEDR